MNRYFWQKGKTLVLVIVLAMGIALPALGEGASIDSVADVKVAFDEAMGKSLQERIPLLEQLEEDIDQAIFDNTLIDKDKAEGLYYKFHTQLQLAKYPESYQTYSAYIQSIQDYSNATRAHSVFYRDVNKWKFQKDYVQCASIGQVLAEDFANDADIASTALFHLAWSKYWMNGTMNQCVQVCNQLIEQYLDSPWRAKTMRLLANAQFALGEHDNALGTLGLLKRQYPDTKLEHYADMRPAAIYEYGKGDPQTALDIYQQSLVNYSDHMYAPYIHRQIERLQEVIEEQLIQDALEGFAKAPPSDCDRKSLIVRAKIEQDDQMVMRF